MVTYCIFWIFVVCCIFFNVYIFSKYFKKCFFSKSRLETICTIFQKKKFSWLTKRRKNIQKTPKVPKKTAYATKPKLTVSYPIVLELKKTFILSTKSGVNIFTFRKPIKTKLLSKLLKLELFCM